jgi:hypothetical protein
MGFDFSAAAKAALGVAGFIADYFPALMGVTIDYPQDGREIQQGRSHAYGRYRWDFGKSEKFVLFHRVDEKYWPQGHANIERIAKKWSRDVDIGPAPGEHYIIIALIESKAMQLVIDYYFQTSNRTGADPLPLDKVGKEWKELASVKINVVSRV